MKVVILCGGQGTRLREHTEHLPKPLVPVGGQPLLWHLMKGCAHWGFDEFVLCLGYKGAKIKEYFCNYETMSGDVTVAMGKAGATTRVHAPPSDRWTVTLADTGEEAMTGARVARIARYLEGERFMVTYGDGVTDLDLRKVLAFHEAHGRIGTVTGVHPPSRFGELLLRGEQVTAFSEKPQVKNSWINGGFFVFEPTFLEYLSTDADCVMERGPLEQLAADGELMAYTHDGFWQCMDTFRDWKSLDDAWARGDAPWNVWDAAPALRAVAS